MNKDSGGDGIPAEPFKILKDDAAKVLHSIHQLIWKMQQWPQDFFKSQFTFQSQRRAMPKNVQTTVQLHSFHMVARLCSKSFKLSSAIREPRTSRYTSWVYKLDFEQAEEPEIKLPTFIGL